MKETWFSFSKRSTTRKLKGLENTGLDITCESSGPEVIKLLSCSTQLSKKFQLLIKTKIPKEEDGSYFKSLRYCVYHANKC